MIRLFFNSLRLAVALVCVGISLILAAQWLNLLPDARLAELEGRKRQCEAIAINAATMIRGSQWANLDAALRSITAQDEKLLSVGVRTQSGFLRLETDGHAENWNQAAEESNDAVAAKDVEPSSLIAKSRTIDTLKVPITLNQYQWGQVELCYQPIAKPGIPAILQIPLARLLIFFVIAGIGIYTLIAARLIGVFNNDRTVPDRVRRALDTLAEGLLLLNEKGTIVLANKSFTETTQCTQEQLKETQASALPWVLDSRLEANGFPWVRAIQTSEMQTEQLLRYRLPDGKFRIFSTNSAPIVGIGGKNNGTLATFRDVTQTEKQRIEMEKMLSVLQSSRDEIGLKNKELEVLATQDPLTGCLNRRAFFEGLSRLWTAAQKGGRSMACVMLDNDHFKAVNDNYGHHVGDQVLRAVAVVLKEVCGEHDLLCRYGGEEFCIVLPGKDAKYAERFAEQLRQKIETVRIEEAPALKTTASFGIADLRYDPEDPQDLINQADRCLYVAKRQGRNRVIVYLPQFAVMETEEESGARSRKVEDKQTESVPFQAVMALFSALAFRDANTAEHSRRVADLAVLAAKGLLDQKQTYILEIGALLHDIGKVGVPDNVLLKPGRLTVDEWKLMNKHDRIGVEIIAGSFNCHELSEIIRTHHAFFGGGGQNSALPEGTNIPVGARLLAICDSYDSMTSDRPYRKGRSHEDAVAELKRCSGTQFDPELVDHFIHKLDGKRQIPSGSPLTVPKQAALQIGLQIERLATALDEQDVDGLQALASRVADVAQQGGVPALATAARQLEEESASEDAEWIHLLGTTVALLELCRETQNAFLTGVESPVGRGAEPTN
ncbi:Cyclic di-GMP phosphodiesterase response regulator RpfG [Roseimaritima multifibrata]|uniref:diguanylate cyclase n=1 Tax=Roseimaritima multifibrata TaxID=1930274 RepID=A0A517MP28_9BACT|nr:diguanylate cyclase [Roseimaritima multifibrata]QDS96632.1 Cyclic di-GMP phosphodiesterase response regulator RpfG [Roseimaritima multifibrata]